MRIFFFFEDDHGQRVEKEGEKSNFFNALRYIVSDIVDHSGDREGPHEFRRIWNEQRLDGFAFLDLGIEPQRFGVWGDIIHERPPS